ncbi:lipocalin family protein [uncultured Tenacibaculum sp.]|uniref:lipocalin family protein n=1 Tax=uncultured Tenacibaculum sp. TaxID=174713 RepID=UPI002632A2E7|nr:lipocalin family protein [uncultured Tenacibaculum sp.]
MKKLLSIAAAILLFVSCSEDETVSDLIIGTWKLEKQVFIDNGQVIDDTTECSKNSTLTFNSDNTITSEFFSDNGTECLSGGVDKGTWKNNGSGVYEFTEDGETTADVITVVFSDNNNTLVIGENTWKRQ